MLGDLVSQLAPVVAKSGFKTSEFWLMALAMGGQMALAVGNHLSGGAASALSMAGSAIYLFRADGAQGGCAASGCRR